MADKRTQLVVRIDDETKKAFMEKVKSEGKTASVLIMNFIESYLNDDYVELLSDDNIEVGDTAITRLEAEISKLKTEFRAMKVEMAGKSAA